MNIYSRAALAAMALLAASALAPLALAADGPPKVVIDSGTLVGTAQGDVLSFKGVPYVAAPVGALRWAPPAPAAAWKGERAADRFGPICPQPVNAAGSPNLGGASGATSEDCLFLNVWAPKGAKRAPVMVWLHGGGNSLGTGSLGAYDGSAFVRDGVILVTINYRLGALGFFAHPALTAAAEPGEPLVGYGIMDQIAALKWVKRDIAAFGGDPANVTLFGESAGGADTLTLMASPLGRGLFAKAIVESGGGWSPPVTLAKREAQGVAIATKAGAPAGATVEQLRALPADALIGKSENLDFGPAVDGRLLTESTSQAFAAGHIAPVPLIIGSNSYEASLMKSLKLPAAMVLAITPATLKAAYTDQPNDQAKAAALFTDAFMGAPAHWIAGKAQAGPAFLYHFAYVLDMLRATAPGAGHDSEIPFVFDSWDHLGALGAGLKLSDADKAMTAFIHSCWVAFARTSVPTCAGAPAWPAYTTAADTLMNFDSPTTLKTHFRAAQYQAQEAAVLPTLGLGK
ncbi:MAG: carboxylesterase family protein [Pseudomonadota bacterium]|nr:carboxylesterase family protein [Pseudomonadota bacterium]